MSISVDIVVTGDDLVANAANAVLARADELQRAEVQPLGERYTNALKGATPRGRGERKDRRLADNYDVDETYSETGATYHIVNDTPYIGYVLKGRGPVVAKPGKMLRFVIDGQVFYRKRVGPAKANPFDVKVAGEMQSDVDGLAERIAGRVIRAHEGGQ